MYCHTVVYMSRLLCYSVLIANGNAEAFRNFLHRVQESANAVEMNNPIVVLANVSFHR